MVGMERKAAMQKLGRRTFVGAGLGATAAALAACGQLSPAAPAARPATKLQMKGWNFKPELVAEHVDIYKKMYADNVEYELIPTNYDAVMETKFIGGQQVDMCYIFPEKIQRWNKAGWIRDSFSAVTMIRYPRLRAVLLFNHDQDGAVWRIDSSTSALRAYRQALSDPIFGLDAKGLVASQGSSSDPSPPAHPQPANHPQPAASHPHRRSGLRCWARHLRRLNVLPTWDVAVPFRCAAAGSGSALGVVTVRTPSGRLLGRARVDLQPRADSELVVGVPGWARSSLRSQWRLRAVVKLVVSSGRYHATTRHIRLVRG